MSEEYILFYSDQCRHSTEFLQKLYKNQGLYKKIVKIEVRDKSIKIPNYIKSVPTMVTTINQKAELLVGNNLFEWLNSITSKNIANTSVDDWDPKAMSGGSYSDTFSFIGNENATEKNFAYIATGNEKIECPQEGSSQSVSNSTNIKSGVEKDFEHLMQQRRLEIPKHAETTLNLLRH